MGCKSVFVTATGTDVGKTYISGLLVKKMRDFGLNCGYYKPALSGAIKQHDGSLLPGDCDYVVSTSGLNVEPVSCVSYCFEEAVSPHLAAKLNDEPIDFGRVEKDYHRAKDKYEYLTMEGSGGIICPLRWDEKQHVILDDLVKHLNLWRTL